MNCNVCGRVVRSGWMLMSTYGEVVCAMCSCWAYCVENNVCNMTEFRFGPIWRRQC